MSVRTDTAAEATIFAACKELHLPTVRDEGPRLADQAAKANLSHRCYLADVLAAEVDDRAERRRVRIIKYRARKFRGGFHDFTIRTGGLEVYPRLVSAEHKGEFRRDRLGSGIAGLDALLAAGSSAAQAA